MTQSFYLLTGLFQTERYSPISEPLQAPVALPTASPSSDRHQAKPVLRSKAAMIKRKDKMDIDQPEPSTRESKTVKAKLAPSEKPIGSPSKQSNSKDGQVTGKRRRVSTPDEELEDDDNDDNDDDNDNDELKQIDREKLHYSVILASDTVHVSEPLLHFLF
jgi:hypothetical protein